MSHELTGFKIYDLILLKLQCRKVNNIQYQQLSFVSAMKHPLFIKIFMCSNAYIILFIPSFLYLGNKRVLTSSLTAD